MSRGWTTMTVWRDTMDHAARSGNHAEWSLSYEIKAVFLLTMGFALVGIDRTIILPLFPVISKDLELTYGDLGLISGILSLTWGVAAILTGHLSDRIGRKKVLIPTVVMFSFLVGCSGFAGGVVSLVIIRGLMGFAEGAYLPASIVSVMDASKPSRVGLNLGLMQMATPLLGLGFGPIAAIALLDVVPSWHWIFVIVAIPGLILVIFMGKMLHHDEPKAGASEPQASVGTVLRQPNVLASAILMIFLISGLAIMGAFMPNYMTDYFKLSLPQMGAVVSGLGFGASVGVLLAPALTDRFGIKLIIFGAMVLELIAVWLLMTAGPEPLKLFLLLSVILGMINGTMVVVFGPLMKRSVPPVMNATATGIVIGVGEIVGGMFAPIIAGAAAGRFGIQVVPLFVIGSVILCVLITAFGIKSPPNKGSMA